MYRFATWLAAIFIAASAYADSCNPPPGFGPFDYSNATARRDSLPVVERVHFTKEVEQLISGASSAVIGADIDYTIRAFPNHYRALDAMSRLAEREKTPRPRGSSCTVQGWFERALRFKNDDAMVYMTYGMHLYRRKELAKAIEQMESAERLAPTNANIQYNLGLLQFEMKNYDKAAKHAQKAYKGGIQLAGLRNKLMQAGKWDARSAVEEAATKVEGKPSQTRQAEPDPPAQLNPDTKVEK